MADTKLSALPELAATPADADEVYIRDVSEIAADESKRITVANLIAGAGGAADFPMKLKPAITRYVLPGWSVNNYTTRSVTKFRIWYIPIFVEETTTYIRICTYVNTASAGAADLRIFNWANGLPDSLVLSAGTVNTGSTGPKEITISQELTRGYYFLAIRLSELSVSLRGVRITEVLASPVAGLAVASNMANYPIPFVSAAYADPAPAPTGVQGADFATVYLREN